MSELASMFVGADQWAWYHVEIIMQRDGAMFGVAGRVFCPGRQEAHLVAAWLVITAHPQANRIACAGCDLFISPSQASTMAASAPTSPLEPIGGVSAGVNGQVFLDGNDTLWVTSRHEGSELGTWAWPTLAAERPVTPGWR